jgi:lycopene cyclase domain-containing protein
MDFGHLSYLVTTLVFGGSAVVSQLFLNTDRLVKYTRLLGVIVALGLVATSIGERIAIAWEAWLYSPEFTLDRQFLGAPVESYLFSIFISLAVAFATLVWTEYEDGGSSVVEATVRRWKNRVTRLRILLGAAVQRR